MPNFSLDAKKLPGAASCTLRLLIAEFFGWNRMHLGGTLFQSDPPEKLIGLRHFWESLEQSLSYFLIKRKYMKIM